ncbi:MAG: site-2 protease family protein [Candidatus Omnitrophica bacterium]|nr:site-2 protease family protein [Candidatus Omnitrophota bacterium]
MTIADHVLKFLVSFVFLSVAMTVHEFCHGWAANKLGDTTAKSSGRLTLNPFSHIDPVNTCLLPLVLFVATRGQFIFGTAKPVPVNFLALKNLKKDIIWIGLSGSLANFTLALVLSVLWIFIPQTGPSDFIFSNLIVINIVLGVFNLIPVPPLDGARIMMGILPVKSASVYARLEPYGLIFVVAFLYLGVIDIFIMPVIGFMLGLLPKFTLVL